MIEGLNLKGMEFIRCFPRVMNERDTRFPRIRGTIIRSNECYSSLGDFTKKCWILFFIVYENLICSGSLRLEYFWRLLLADRIRKTGICQTMSLKVVVSTKQGMAFPLQKCGNFERLLHGC